jgi:soluble cytochrome b562
VNISTSNLRLLIIAERDKYNRAKEHTHFPAGYILMLDRAERYAANGCDEEALTALKSLQSMQIEV